MHNTFCFSDYKILKFIKRLKLLINGYIMVLSSTLYMCFKRSTKINKKFKAHKFYLKYDQEAITIDVKLVNSLTCTITTCALLTKSMLNVKF
jgi:hypothetical protein